MSLADLLNITCDVFRTTVTQDSTGAEVKTLTLKHSDLPCRIVEKSANERAVFGREGVVSTHTLYMEFVNLIERDIIKITVHTITGTTIAFVDSDPDTITDSGNGFITAGFEAGSITVSGSANNNGDFTVDREGIAAGTLTLISSDSLTAEAAGATVTINQFEQYDVVKVGDWARENMYLKIDVVERI
jgi:hypothetical protein